MIKVIKKLTSSRFNQVISALPEVKKRKIELLYLFLVNGLKIKDISLISVDVLNTERYLLFLPQINVFVDYEFRSEIEFIGGNHYLDSNIVNDLDAWNADDTEYITTDFRKDLENTIKSSLPLHYVNINSIITLKQGKFIIDKYFLENLMNADYYVGKDILNQDDILYSWFEIMKLFHLDYDGDYIDSDGNFIYCEVPQNKLEEIDGNNVSSIFVYSTSQLKNSVAISKDSCFLREIGSFNNIEYLNKNHYIRYVFATENWGYAFKVRDKKTDILYELYMGNVKKMTLQNWSKEQYKLHIFMGVYKLQYEQSIKEGLLVWKRINKTIKF